MTERGNTICPIGLRGAPKISVLRGSEGTVRVSVPEFRFGSYFTLRFQNNNGRGGKIIVPLRLAIVNDLLC